MGWGTVARGSAGGRKLVKTNPLDRPDEQDVCSGLTRPYHQLLVIDGELQKNNTSVKHIWATFHGIDGTQLDMWKEMSTQGQ